MKKFLLLIFALVPIAVYGPAEKSLTIGRNKPVCPYLTLFDVVASVESNNIANSVNLNDPYPGSWGIVQISLGKLTDFNRANHTSYTLIDCLDVEVSRKVFVWHMEQYKSIELGVRAWNGRYELTENYWKRITSMINNN